MLNSLYIKNYALIEQLEVCFRSGLTTITGETGAGKSILLGGFSLVLGKRADLSSLKNKGEKCIIEAVFDVEKYSLQPFFDKHGLDYSSQTIIRREILPLGKTRAFVNDTPVTLDILDSLGALLIDIHSQFETEKITNSNFQMEILDAVASNKELLSQYRFSHKEYLSINKKIGRAKIISGER